MSKKKEKDVVKNDFIFIEWIQHIVLATSYGVLFLFLAVNILVSQSVPSLYFQFVKEQPEAVVDFFKRARTLPSFKSVFAENKYLFISHEREIYQEERQRRQLIAKLEAILTENQNARDVLYSLSLLYEKEGDDIKAREYLQKAQDLDPRIGK